MFATKPRSLCAAVAAGAVLSACTVGSHETVPAVVTSTVLTTVENEPVQSEPVQSEGQPAQERLQAVADSVAQTFGGSVGVAVAGAGGALAGGDDGRYPAWSTIKVPIAIAASRLAPVEAEVFGPAAIQASDNVAAESLWLAVTPGDVNQVLADAGVGTTVNTEKIRPEYSVFGQTLLTASQEATLASYLGCVAGAGPTLSLMGSVNSDQAYGFGQLAGARLKGGWGPSTSGGYQVRQLALVSNSRGEDVALGLTVIPASGDYATGQAMAAAVAEGLRPLLDDLPTAAC
nr:class A beta-lactamase-related serine hydrolase [Corynebacterium qintianiae]